MKKLVRLREALEDPDYFGSLLAGDSWANWRTMLVAIVGEELTPEERVIFKDLTGRPTEPAEPVSEFWAIIGRRGGKSRSMATLAAYLAACIDYRDVLGPGERGKLPLLAASTVQAQQIYDFVHGIFEQSPNLRGLVESATSDTISLSSGIDIQVRPASYRTIRGVTAIGAICDELAFWRSDDSANPDKEILKALRPALATTGGPLIAISSPYAKRGELYSTFRRHFGPNGHPSILVAKAASRVMNPGLSEAVVARAYEEDPDGANAEYGAEFRSDIEAFVSREAVEACVAFNVRERAPVPGVVYSGFVDPSGGSADSMTLAIGHREGDVALVDAIREIRPPFSPESAVADLAETLKSYRVTKIIGDRYAGNWPVASFKNHAITYEQSAKPKSDLYRDLLPALNSRRIELLDDPRLVSQLCTLERRTARGGRDSIDHAPGAHDDVANSVAGLVSLIGRGNYDSTYAWVGALRSFTNEITGGSEDEGTKINSSSFARQFWPRP